MSQQEKNKQQRIGVLALVALLLAVGFGFATAVQAGDDEGDDAGPTPCERTAWRMNRACRIDAREEFNIAIANCLNLGSAADREDCRDEALEVRNDAPEECWAQLEARFELCDLLGEYRYDPDPLLDPANIFIDPDEVPQDYPANPLRSLEEERVWVLRSDDELVVILNSDENREILDVPCRIVAEVAVEEEEEEDDGTIEYEYVPVEVTYDFHAQTTGGDIVYCGENTVESEDGFPTSADGTFIAGVDSAKSGYLHRFDPIAGEADRQEFALDDAEDWVLYQDLSASVPDEFGGDNEAFPCAGGCIQTLEGTPQEPEVIELKYYVPGVGFVLALPFELNDDGEFEWTGEREELVCMGDSLDILESDECDITDPEELLETLCNVAGDFFCD